MCLYNTGQETSWTLFFFFGGIKYPFKRKKKKKNLVKMSLFCTSKFKHLALRGMSQHSSSWVKTPFHGVVHLSVSGTVLVYSLCTLACVLITWLVQNPLRPSKWLQFLSHSTSPTVNRISHSRVPVKTAGTQSPWPASAPWSTRCIFQIPAPVPGFPVFLQVRYQFQIFCNRRIRDGWLKSVQAKT